MSKLQHPGQCSRNGHVVEFGDTPFCSLQMLGKCLHPAPAMVEDNNAVPSCEVCRLRGAVASTTNALHVKQLFYPEMLRGIGVDMYLN
jgi:hypothetical protein